MITAQQEWHNKKNKNKERHDTIQRRRKIGAINDDGRQYRYNEDEQQTGIS